MLFWILIIVAIACTIWVIHDDWYHFLPMFTSVISVALVVVSISIMMFSYIGIDGYIAENEIRYEMLTYQYENDIYDNDNDIGKRELMTDIQSWNEMIATKQANQDDFWIGIYIPNIYDQFEYIELK